MEDYISELSDDVLSFIFSFLPMKDVFRMRILSRRWRYLSPAGSLLQLDASTVGIGDTTSLSNIADCSPRFVAAVDQILQDREIPSIDSLRVHFPLLSAFCSHIDRWVEVSSSKGAERIDFDLSFPRSLPRSPSKPLKTHEIYHFPFHLLPANGTTRLKHLSLKLCRFGPSSDFTRLNCLSTLDLTLLALNQSSCDSILQNCVNLRVLRLIDCGLRDVKLCIHGQLPLLKTLAIHANCLLCMEIDSVNLETFEFHCDSLRFDFVNVPCLKWVSLRTVALSQCFTVKSDLPELRVLSLLLRYGGQVYSLPSTIRFRSLKQLNLYICMDKRSELVCITYLLNASPFLEILHMTFKFFEGELPPTNSDYMFQKDLHLREVAIKCFQGVEYEMELAKWLIRNSIKLEQMVIHVAEKLFASHSDLQKRVDDELREELINPTTKLIVL